VRTPGIKKDILGEAAAEPSSEKGIHRIIEKRILPISAVCFLTL
jgi:hypothetical protein